MKVRIVVNFTCENPWYWHSKVPVLYAQFTCTQVSMPMFTCLYICLEYSYYYFYLEFIDKFPLWNIYTFVITLAHHSYLLLLPVCYCLFALLRVELVPLLSTKFLWAQVQIRYILHNISQPFPPPHLLM